MISRETIERIFDTSRIEEVIGDFVTLKRSGSNLKGLSPFSNEKTPSFMVSPAKQIFKDFSSGKGGNVVSFLMEHEHYTYPEALRYLAKKYGIDVEETGQTDEQKEARSERESLYLVNDFASRYFQEKLWESDEGKAIGLTYFKERGFTEETIKAFQLGYSLESYEAFTDEALKNNYQLEFLEKTGLTKVDGSRKTDRFRGRVIFPILSHTGRVLGFGARTLKKEAKIAKYLNSPESPIYHKSRTLYGLFQAKSHLSKEDNCLLVEGYTDVISLFQADVKNVVASSGTSLTVDQINLIKRYTRNITILYDGDAAGIKASLRGIDMILGEGLNVNVLLFPEGEDPDSYSQKVSSTELKDYIEEEAQDFLKFKASLLLKEAGDNPLERSRAAREIVQSIALIPGALERDAYVKECSKVLHIDEKVLASELAQLRKTIQGKKDADAKREATKEASLKVVQQEPRENIQLSSFYDLESFLCGLLLNFGQKEYGFNGNADEDEDAEMESVGAYILNEILEDQLEFETPIFQEILVGFADIYEKEERIPNADHFLRTENQRLIDAVVSLITDEYHLHNWSSRNIHTSGREATVEKDTVQAVLRFKERKIGKLIMELQEELSRDTSKSSEKMEVLMKLTILKNKINKKLERVV